MTVPTNATERAFSKTLRTIRLLLAKADDAAATPEESATYRAKAESLMRQYRVEEESLLAEDPRAVEPMLSDIDIARSTSAFWQEYVDLYHSVADHVGVKVRFVWTNGTLLARTIGYESDIRYAEALYTSAALVFGVKLEPSFDPALSEAENVYRLRSSGMTRKRVAQVVFGEGPYSEGYAAHARVGKIYKAECLRRGETIALDGKGVDLKTFREQYAQNFCYEFGRRLYAARDAADSTGGTLQLHGRADRVQEAYFRMFPEMRPSTATEAHVPDSGPKKKAPKPRKWTKKDQADYERRTSGKAAQAGSQAGRDAAAEVELNRSHTPAKRLDTPEAEVIGCFGELRNF